MTEETVRTTYFVRGRVQGVGFRWWTRSQALELGLVGHARNIDDGRVEVVAQGPTDAVAELGRRLSPTAAVDPSGARRRPGRVESCVALPGRVRPDVTGFVEK
ncbi:acylphosphatase [Arsenicicoccus dermatophilus]|uniref:acylphosphatase n=1 Tax=Arsenicicoccus dermatophilus TaxID=1076331 RepID=UPI0039174B38